VPACLRSLRDTYGGPFETILVDNASSDGTILLVGRDFPEALIVRNTSNRGFAKAVNQGARRASGSYLLLLNPDTVMAAGSLEKLVRSLENEPAAGVAGAQLLNADGSLQISAWTAPSLVSLLYEALLLRNLIPQSPLGGLRFDDSRVHAVDCVSGACFLVRRDCFQVLGGLDEGFFLYHEDVDFCLRARRQGFEVRLVAGARVVHLLGATSFKDRRAFLLRFSESRDLLIRKHYKGLKSCLLRSIHRAGLGLKAVVYSVAGLLTDRLDFQEEAHHHAAAHRHLLTRGAL